MSGLSGRVSMRTPSSLPMRSPRVALSTDDVDRIEFPATADHIVCCRPGMTFNDHRVTNHPPAALTRMKPLKRAQVRPPGPNGASLQSCTGTTEEVCDETPIYPHVWSTRLSCGGARHGRDRPTPATPFMASSTTSRAGSMTAWWTYSSPNGSLA